MFTLISHLNFDPSNDKNLHEPGISQGKASPSDTTVACNMIFVLKVEPLFLYFF